MDVWSLSQAPQAGMIQKRPVTTFANILISIGAASAHEFRARGTHLALTYTTSKARIHDLIASLPSTPGRISTHQVDLSIDLDVERLLEEIREQHERKGPDILVSNAGYGKRIPDITDISIEEWDRTIQVNLRASFLLCRLAIPHMQEQGWGRIILVSSIAGHGGGINGCHYAASKAGLMGMAKNLAAKLASHGITVNDVAPAMIGETGMIPNAEFVKGTPGDVDRIPVRRLGSPKEVANVVTMLCETGYITGQTIVIAGGLK